MSAPENEFAEVQRSVEALGIAPSEIPPVHRRWVNVSTGGHISGVTWGAGSPEIVLLHRRGLHARSLDLVALLLRRPAVVIDLPGAGRSNGPYTSARRAASSLSEAVASFAPRATVIAGIGEGALVALATVARRPQLARLVLIDALPGAGEGDDRLLWDQLAGVAATAEVALSLDAPVDDQQIAELHTRRPDARVSRLESTDELLETSGAPAVAASLLATWQRQNT